MSSLLRVALQIEPDGRQPLELRRTRAWGYSVGNLEGLMTLAALAEHVGVDLWRYQTSDGRSLRRALDFLYPYAVGERKWDYRQLGEWQPQALHPLVRRAAARYDDAKMRAMLAQLPAVDPSDRAQLLGR